MHNTNGIRVRRGKLGTRGSQRVSDAWPPLELKILCRRLALALSFCQRSSGRLRPPSEIVSGGVGNRGGGEEGGRKTKG